MNGREFTFFIAARSGRRHQDGRDVAFLFSEKFFLDKKKGSPNADVSHPPKSPETGIRTFSAEKSRKSPDIP
jgi:hypothetical protein